MRMLAENYRTGTLSRMRWTSLLVLSTLLSFQIACSSAPSQSDARDVLMSKYQDEIENGLVILESFSKVNSQQGEMFGVKFYVVEYEAQIRWPKGLNTECLGDNSQFKGWDCWMKEARAPGKIEKLQGNLTFEKTERGWKGENGEIY